MHSWVDRLMHQENWKPVAREKGCARRVFFMNVIILYVDNCEQLPIVSKE